MKTIFGVISLWLLTSASAFSAVLLRMPNGEVLRGEVVEQNEDQIVFHSESFGLLTLPSSLLTASAPEAPASQGSPAEPTPATARTAPAERTGEAPPVGKIRQWLRLPEHFEANLMIGLDFLRSELDVDNYMVELNTNWKGDRHEFMTYHRYEYGNVMGTRTLDEYENSARWIFPFHDRWILLSQVNWLSDSVRLIDYEINLLSVPAYYFIRNEKTTLLAGLGVGHLWERFDLTGSTADSYFNVVGYQLLRHRFTEKLNIEQTFLGYISPDDTDQHRYLLELTLQRMLTDALSINLRYSYNYDNTPAPEVDEVKERTILMMGYRF